MSDEPRKQRSIEYGGVGQSGYTAGRQERDRALEQELEPEYLTFPHDAADEVLADELGVDDRFTGRGGSIRRDAAT